MGVVAVIEEESNPARGRRGRHHGAHRYFSNSEIDRSDIRQIAVHVSQDAAGDIRLQIANHLAASLCAQLLAIASVIPELPPAIALPDAKAPLASAASISHTEIAHRSGKNWQTRNPFKGRAPEGTSSKRGFAQEKTIDKFIAQQWHTISHGSQSEMLSYAKMADLTILGQRAEDQPRHLSPSEFRPEDIAIASGRPTLIIPNTLSSASIGLNILVAWDGSRETVRALHDSMPLMRDAEQIVVLELRENTKAFDTDMPGADTAIEILERHGFQAFQAHRSDSLTIVDSILKAIEASRADLLVCGVLQRSFLRESIFGGISRELLRRAPVAILGSH